MRWSEGCWCWTKPTVTCTGGLFVFPKAVAHILNACIVICTVVVEVVAVVVVVVYIYIYIYNIYIYMYIALRTCGMHIACS